MYIYTVILQHLKQKRFMIQYSIVIDILWDVNFITSQRQCVEISLFSSLRCLKS